MNEMEGSHSAVATLNDVATENGLCGRFARHLTPNSQLIDRMVARTCKWLTHCCSYDLEGPSCSMLFPLPGYDNVQVELARYGVGSAEHERSTCSTANLVRLPVLFGPENNFPEAASPLWKEQCFLIKRARADRAAIVGPGAVQVVWV